MKISSVTILYNFDKDVINNIKTYENFVDEVILIDNSDEKKYYEKYRKDIEKYTYISMNGNVGIAKALNEGVNYSKEKGYEWVLTMDQDSKFHSDIISKYLKILNYFNTNDIAVLAPNYFFDRKKTKEYKGYKELSYTMQSGNLINIEIYEKIGKFKEDFFIDGVDYEYCIRANRNKYKVIECGEAILYHNPGITKKTFFGFKYGYCNSLRIYYQVRNLLWIFSKYKNIKMIAIIIYKFFKILLLFDNKKEYFYMFKLGVIDFKKRKARGKR